MYHNQLAQQYHIIIQNMTINELSQQIQLIKQDISAILPHTYTQEIQAQRKVVLMFSNMRDCFIFYIEMKKLCQKCYIATVPILQCQERAKAIANDYNAGEKISYIMNAVQKDQNAFNDDIQGKDELLEFYHLLKQKQ